MTVVDVIVIGAGIAGASVGYELADTARVCVLEAERIAGYHATGRSAALLTENYGNETVRRLTLASRSFFERPPEGFAETPMLTPRGVLWLARRDQQASLERVFDDGRALVPSIRRIGKGEAYALCPILRKDYMAAAVLEPDAMDIDVNALHQGYLRGLRRRGGELRLDAAVRCIRRGADGWQVTTSSDQFVARTIVNAAGAWGDEIARLAGVPSVGLSAMRRTAFMFSRPDGLDLRSWPVVLEVDERFYFKPESGRILGSPADETPVAPCDVMPEDLDIAEAVDRIERASTLKVRRIESRWAGLRTFIGDRVPVVGMEPDAAGFFWLVGQGGYGIMTAPALARLSAALIVDGSIPEDLMSLGARGRDLSPKRLRNR